MKINTIYFHASPYCTWSLKTAYLFSCFSILYCFFIFCLIGQYFGINAVTCYKMKTFVIPYFYKGTINFGQGLKKGVWWGCMCARPCSSLWEDTGLNVLSPGDGFQSWGFYSHFDSYEKMYPKSFLTVVSGCSIFHVNDPKDNMYLCRVVFWVVFGLSPSGCCGCSIMSCLVDASSN